MMEGLPKGVRRGVTFLLVAGREWEYDHCPGRQDA
jgi:hypothetical protein